MTQPSIEDEAYVRNVKHEDLIVVHDITESAELLVTPDDLEESANDSSKKWVVCIFKF